MFVEGFEALGSGMFAAVDGEDLYAVARGGYVEVPVPSRVRGCWWGGRERKMEGGGGFTYHVERTNVGWVFRELSQHLVRLVLMDE